MAHTDSISFPSPLSNNQLNEQVIVPLVELLEHQDPQLVRLIES
jgi:hypothetical protein